MLATDRQTNRHRRRLKLRSHYVGWGLKWSEIFEPVVGLAPLHPDPFHVPFNRCTNRYRSPIVATSTDCIHCSSHCMWQLYQTVKYTAALRWSHVALQDTSQGTTLPHNRLDSGLAGRRRPLMCVCVWRGLLYFTGGKARRHTCSLRLNISPSATEIQLTTILVT